MRELYVIEFESANYAGAGHTALVWAASESEAEDAFNDSGWGEEYYHEQDYDQFVEENGLEEAEYALWSTVVSATKLKGSRYEQYAKMESQREFYQIVN